MVPAVWQLRVKLQEFVQQIGPTELQSHNESQSGPSISLKGRHELVVSSAM